MPTLVDLRQTLTQALIRESRILREESLEWWEGHEPNVSVYAVEGFNDGLSGQNSDAQNYATGRTWFELMLTVLVEGAPRHYIAIIDALPVRDGDSSVGGRAYGKDRVRSYQELMRIPIPEFIQVPKGIGLVSIPSLVRLKAVDSFRASNGIPSVICSKRRGSHLPSMGNPVNRLGLRLIPTSCHAKWLRPECKW